jgi:NADPH:quinone reductase-like Zn-dependent oxidoreductase
MKVKRVQFNHYGSASEMYMGEYELPQLKENDVQVSVKAAAINPLDWKQRQGSMKLFMDRQFPKGIGSDFSGVVEAVGSKVVNFQPGDEVFGTMDVKKPGAFAEVLVTDARFLTQKPLQLTFAEAACLPIPAATAWAALFVKTKLSANSRMLINGCTGAVGLMAVQLAAAVGAEINGTCSPASMDLAKVMGVNAAFNYADERYQKDTESFDIIFDTAGTMSVGRALSMLNPKGVFIDINPTPQRMIRGIFFRRYKLAFATMGTSYLPAIAERAALGVLKSAIGLETNFSDAVATITAVEAGKRNPGRVVLTF